MKPLTTNLPGVGFLQLCEGPGRRRCASLRHHLLHLLQLCPLRPFNLNFPCSACGPGCSVVKCRRNFLVDPADKGPSVFLRIRRGRPPRSLIALGQRRYFSPVPYFQKTDGSADVRGKAFSVHPRVPSREGNPGNRKGQEVTPSMQEKTHDEGEEDKERLCEAVSPANEVCGFPALVRCTTCGGWFCDAHAEDKQWHHCVSSWHGQPSKRK